MGVSRLWGRVPGGTPVCPLCLRWEVEPHSLARVRSPHPSRALTALALHQPPERPWARWVVAVGGWETLPLLPGVRGA